MNLCPHTSEREHFKTKKQDTCKKFNFQEDGMKIVAKMWENNWVQSTTTIIVVWSKHAKCDRTKVCILQYVTWLDVTLVTMVQLILFYLFNHIKS